MHLKRSDLVGANCPFVRHERPAVGLLPQQPAAEPREPAHIERRYGAGDGLAEQDRNLDSRQHREDAAWGLGVVKVPDEGGNQRPSGRQSGAIGGRVWVAPGALGAAKVRGRDVDGERQVFGSPPVGCSRTGGRRRWKRTAAHPRRVWMEALLEPKKPLMREAIRCAISMHSIRAAARGMF